MAEIRFSRRDLLEASTAIAAGCLAAPVAGTFAQPAYAQAMTAAPPEPSAITPALIEAAKKEGKLAFYTAMDLPVAERFARAFEAKFPGVTVRAERSGAERIFQRIGQEYGSRIHAADLVNSADAAHFIVWKRNDWLAPYLPEEVARVYPKQYYDPNGLFVTTRVWLSSLGYNTNLVKADDAPKSFADLLDSKWAGKMVKAHPAYSGTIMTATFQLVREIGWGYLEKLAKQRIMQVQSSTDPPKKLALGERAVMADGNDYNLIQLKEAGQPVEVVYHRTDRGIQERAQSECGPLVPELAALARGAATAGRLRPPAFGPSAGQGEARPQEAHGDQAVEGRSRRGREDERRDQDPLRADLQGMIGGRDRMVVGNNIRHRGTQ
jgi:iron(III) transport system substrate-binding protein